MNEVRRTGGERDPSEPNGQACAEPKQRRSRGAWGGWRWNVQKCMFMNQGYLFWCWKEQDRSQSPHSSEEAGNDRGAKEDRKVEA